MTSVLLVAIFSMACVMPPPRPAPRPVQKPAATAKTAKPPATAPPQRATPAPPSPLVVTPSPPVSREYVVGPEDVLRITVIGEADMSKEYRVNADGKFEFPMMTTAVQAGGFTARAIADTLTKGLSDFIKRPQVTVEVAMYRSQKVWVTGDVQKPGPYTLEGPTSLLDILSRAGWNAATGGDEIQVLHPRVTISGPLVPTQIMNADVQRVSVADLQSGKLLSVAIRDGDTVWVPKAPTFFIQGQVRNPNEYVIKPRMTVEQAIIVAGGMTDRGTTGRLKVRRIVNGKLKEVPIKLTDLVLPNDTITVPQRFF